MLLKIFIKIVIMLYVFKQLRSLFVETIFVSNFKWSEELSSKVETAANSWNVLTIKEYNKLLEEFKDNQDELNKAVLEKTKNQFYKDQNVLDILKSYNSRANDIVLDTVEAKKPIKEIVSENFRFTRTLKKWLKWDDVIKLQEYLWIENDWDFWPATEKALKKFQKDNLGFKNPDWVMDLNGKTMNYITKDINTKWAELTEAQKNTKYWKEATDVINNLDDTQKFIKAFNKTYGWEWELISRHNGLFWIVNHLNESDLDRLVDELNPDFSHIDNDKIANELWLDKNWDKYNDWLKRFAMISIISAILSWGSSLALEIFAINFWDNYEKWPELEKILSLLNNKEVDFRKEMKEMYVSESTTLEWLNEVLDKLNDPDMDTANLKRLADEVFQPNWIQRVLWIFQPENYSEVQDLINEFENTKDLDDAKKVIKEIYTFAYKAHLKSKVNLIKAEKDYNDALKDYNENPNEISLDNTSLSPKQKLSSAKYNLESARDEFKEWLNALAKLWDTTSRYTNLNAKREKLLNIEFDSEEARKREVEIDKELWNKNLSKISERLYSENSFWYKVDTSKLNNKEYMTDLVSKMKQESINWESSVLSWLIRWIEHHYFAWAKTFTAEEFIAAFENTAEKTESKYVLSNLWREKNQKFQWTIWEWELFKIKLNNKDIFFKDKCTNIVTVVNPLETTINSTNSFPIVITLDTWLDNAWKSNWWDWNWWIDPNNPGWSWKPWDTHWSTWGIKWSEWTIDPPKFPST